MTARLLAAVAALTLVLGTCLAEDDLSKDFEQKAAKAEQAQLAADWTLLDASAALLRFRVAKREQGWRVHLPKFEDLAARRYAARDDAEKLAKLDAELLGLESEVETHAATLTHPDSPVRGAILDLASGYDLNHLVSRLEESVVALEEKHGAEHADVKAGLERLRELEQAANAWIEFQDIESVHYLLWEATELLRQHKREYDAAIKKQSVAAAAHKVAVKARDDHVANAPGADATKELRDAYHDKARELDEAVESAERKLDEAARAVDGFASDVRSQQERLETKLGYIRYSREKAAKANGPEWVSIQYGAPEELATAAHVQGFVQQHSHLERLTSCVAATHLDVVVVEIHADRDAPAVETIAAISKLPKLKVLNMSLGSGSMDREKLKLLANLSELQELNLHARDWPDPACLSELAAFKNCRIRLMGSLGGNPVASHLKNLAGASELVLEFTGWPAEKGLGEALGSLPNLTRLSLPAASEIAAAIKAKKLHTVRADRLDADLVKALKAHPAITTLDLTDSNVTSADLALLSELPHLKQLVLSGCLALDEFALPPLRKLGHLESIDLTATPIRLWAIRLLKHQMPKLKVLH